MKRLASVQEFGDVMRALGGYLEEKDREILVAVAWSLVPFDQRRAGPLLPARPYRSRVLPWPKDPECRVPIGASVGKSGQRRGVRL